MNNFCGEVKVLFWDTHAIIVINENGTYKQIPLLNIKTGIIQMVIKIICDCCVNESFDRGMIKKISQILSEEMERNIMILDSATCMTLSFTSFDVTYKIFNLYNHNLGV